MKRRTLIAIAGVAGLAVLLGVSALALTARSSDAGLVEVVREDLPIVVEAQGRLEAAVAYEIGPPSVQNMWDYDLSWMIQEGRRVKEGDVVARFDATEIEDQLRDYRAQLETVKQEREKEQRNLAVTLEELRLDVVKAENDLEELALDLALDESLLSAIEIQELRLERQLATERLAHLREKMASQRELVDSKLALLDVKRGYFETKAAQLQEVIDKFNVKSPPPGS
ncbi:MAG: efflux RND transporter periplasmic adaptor subunit [Acidobacteria bacterium]|nr:efflux RND transporter periplasmic adaptor subunit [Acidobacteriota bacterium]